MADRPSVVGNIFKSPILVVLVIILVLLIGGYAANFYLKNINANRTDSYLAHANQLKVLSQQMAMNARAAAGGDTDAFGQLSKSRSQFDAGLGALRDGNPSEGVPASPPAAQDGLQQLTKMWADARTGVGSILSNRDSIVSIATLSDDLATSVAAISALDDNIVAEMLKQGATANQVALAQRQNLLMQKIALGVDKVIPGGVNDGLSANLQDDSKSFKRVLDGLMNGDKGLQLTPLANKSIQASLSNVEQKYVSISRQVDEILARSGDIAQARQAAQAIAKNSPRFLAVIDNLTGVYKSPPGIGLASPLVGIALAVGALVVLLIIGLVIYRIAMQGARVSVRQNEQNQAAILQLLDELADLADGDLRVQATVTENFTGAIADSINFSVDQMRGLVSRINETSAQVSSAADTTQSSVSQLSEASQRQAKEISDVSEAVNEMAVSIDNVSLNAAESSSVAEKSVGIANKGAAVVQNTIDGMDKIRGQIQETAKRVKRLGESSQEIGDIVLLINDIADQTNILSLNAAIQASMAGDAGKGFAVVADEVQRLAERSGAAAKQISTLIKAIQSDTNEAVTSMEQTTAEVVQGTRLAQDAGVALGEIENVSKSLAEIIENISAAARQQATSAGKISNTMKSIHEITSKTTEGTQSTVVAVGNLANMTDELRASVTGFKLPEG